MADLENNYPIYSVLRAEDEPRFFHYLVAFADGGLMHEFDYVADDSTSPHHVFIEDFVHESSSE